MWLVDNGCLSSWFSSTTLWQKGVALAVSFLVAVYWKIKPHYVPASLPGPQRYPVIGFLLHVMKHWPHWPSETARLASLHKTTYGGPLPNFGTLPGAYFYVHDEENLKFILKDAFDCFGKSDVWQIALGELLGEGIFAVDGKLWIHHRKIMATMFSKNLLRSTASVTHAKLNEVVQLLHDKFQKQAKEDKPRQTCEIDIQDLFFRLTMDVTANFTFGVELNSISRPEQHDFAKAFDELSMLCQQRFQDPFCAITKYFKLTRNERRIRQLTGIVNDFALSIIQHKRRSSDSQEDGGSSSLGPDLLSRFLDQAHKTGEVISNQELRDIIMNIILAGRDTTAVALSWTFYELTRNPKVVEKIVDEVHGICGVSGNTFEEDGNGDCSYDAISKLKYTHAVAMEVLRLHPPVPVDPRFALKECTLPDGTHIPAGAGVTLLFNTIATSSKLWGDDADQFRPERFLDGPKKNIEPSTFQYPIFNAGPRLCLGKPLALMNMKLAMAVLLPKFKFEDEVGHSGDYEWSLVQKMKDGFVVSVNCRDNN